MLNRRIWMSQRIEANKRERIAEYNADVVKAQADEDSRHFNEYGQISFPQYLYQVILRLEFVNGDRL